MDRAALLALLDRNHDEFRAAVGRFVATVPAVPPADSPEAPVDGWADLLPRERRLVWRAWLLDDCAFGITLSGAAYEDNPIHYANQRFRELTGYPLDRLRGENPRLLQGPATEPAAVADLHAALRGWNRVTVELWNYRADGERFRNRLSLLPVPDGTGTITHWYGVQERVD